ncbi:MAG: cold-shock protein [Polyangiales bacterium]
MAEGKIKRLTDRGFGFIEMTDGKDMFFHMSACMDCTFDDLKENQAVSFDVGEGPKGPRADNVRRI